MTPSLLSLPTATISATNAETELGHIADELTRRGFLAGGVGSAALLGLAACGSSGSDADSSSSSALRTRLVTTVKGTVTVPATPKRVVGLYLFVDNALFDLGVSPVAIFDQGAQYVSPRYEKQWTATPKINAAGASFDLEKIAAMRPDLILGSDIAAISSIYLQLTQIAPTVLTAATPWQDLARGTADAMNKTTALEQLEKRFTQRAAQIKTTYADVLSRLRFDTLQGGFDKGQFYSYGPNSLIGLVLAGAGVQFAAASTASASSTTPGVGIRSISYENIDQLHDADVIAYYSTYAGAPNNLGPQLFAQPLWKALPAIKAGRLIPIPDFLVGGYGDALAVLDELEAGLKKIGASS